jgi:hypothetical protein
MTSQRPKPSERAKITRLEKIVEDFAIDNAVLRQRVAELESKHVEHWVPLKSADRGLYSYSTALRWANRGLVRTKRVGGRLFVDSTSLREFMAMRSNATRG